MSYENDAALVLRLQRLLQANQALAQVESLSELLPQLLRFAQEVTDAEASSILLYKPETQSLEFTLAYNETKGTAESIIDQKIELKLGEGIAGTVALERKSTIVANAQKDMRFCKQVDDLSGFQTRSILCAPIINQDELLGVVQVLNSKKKHFFDEEDLVLLEGFSHLAGVAIVRSRMLEALLQQERLQAQLDAAARIQNNFLPKIPDIGPGHQIRAVTKPAIFVGGDFYDLIPLADGSLLLCVADVSGKGLPAALIGATLWTTVRSLVPRHDTPAQLLTALNEEIYEVMASQMFATMVCCRYWPQSAEALISLAGHIPPLCIQGANIESVSQLKGKPLGIFPKDEFNEVRMNLPNQASLLFFTDGLTEARNVAGDFFGEEQLKRLTASENQGPYFNSVLESVDNWQRGKDASDDLTLVEIWRH